ncbi:MAG: hypothetical protein EOO05_21275 [Chitinophagaceae bacterium]|nr:MAG: hypothetical protein EOO05_21275 [Chitinophagaceae bacterium]
MKQMEISNHQVIELDFEDPWYSDTVRTLRPVAYNDGQKIYCMLGPDFEHAILGSGTTLVEALKSWDAALQKRIEHHSATDEVALYVKDQLNASLRKIN